jgi:hypothetical protein
LEKITIQFATEHKVVTRKRIVNKCGLLRKGLTQFDSNAGQGYILFGNQLSGRGLL